MKIKYLFVIIFFSLTSCSNNFKTIDSFQLIFTDVDNFWSMYDDVKFETNEKKRVLIIKKEYFNKATYGLRKLIKKDKLTPEKYSNYLKDTLFYNSIRETVIDFKKDSLSIKNSIKKFSEIYPKTKYSNIYFVIGLFFHGGVNIDNSIIIEPQHFTKTDSLKNFSLLNSYIGKSLMTPESLIPLIIHEQVHLNQKNKRENSLLRNAIVEGSANFLMYLSTKKVQSSILKTYKYGEENEEKIWNKFKSDRKKELSSVENNWYNNYNRNDVHPDLGYFIGHKICENYYNNSTDKKKAIEFLLTEKDYEKILILSKYDEKFD